MSGPQEFRASGWRPVASGTSQGFFTLLLPSGLVINDLTLHERDGKRWIRLRGKPQIDQDGNIRKDPSTGKRLYTPVIEIPSGGVCGFQTAAIAAVDRLLGE
jgi:hypothetical protein